MARQARQISKSGNYYIELHGEELFVTKDDKERFMEILSEKFEDGKVYGAEIGKTEIRMAVKEPENGISMAMKSVTTIYARYFNRANNHEGKIFEGRFKSVPLETKKEVDECVENLRIAAPSKKKTTAPKKPVAPKKAPAPKKQEEIAPKPAPKKNLPSWLL